jgi:tRNA(Ile)-lysidine synthase TilS/MesJ/uncharacterized protein (DUF924 family)
MDLIQFWFDNEHLWFGATSDDDRYIAETFGGEMKVALFETPKTPKDILKTILLLDQVVWHYDRVHGTSYQKKYNSKAITLSMEAIDICCEDINDMIYTNAQKCFIMLPLRHSPYLDDHNVALHYIKKFRKEYPMDSYLKRFHKQTICKRSKLIKPILQNPDVKNINIDELLDNGTICDKSTFDPLLPTDMTLKIDIKIMRNIRKILGSVKKKVIVSFSCGSDSALCAYLCKRAGYEVCCMMVNYNNRDSMADEVKLARYWTSQMNIPFFVRTIEKDEITRTQDHDRDLYEEVTKVIRFDSYKHLINILNTNMDDNSELCDDIPVILGHNGDDVGENLNANIIQGINYHFLPGMKESCKDQGVILKRIILILTKDEVVDLSNKLNIPSVFDSTPEWSRRGKMRDRLIPVEKEFGLLRGLFALGEHLKDVDDFVLAYVRDHITKMRRNVKTITDNGKTKSITTIFEFDGIIVNNFIVIKRLFMELSNDKSLGIKQPTNKSINNFVNMLKERGAHCFIKSTMNPTMFCTYDGHTLSIINR